jgi:AraC-like DNA-binding protein
MDSPYLDVHEDTSYTKDYVTLHSHEFYELLFCRSGNLQYLIGNTRYQIRKNDIILVPPGTSHRPLFLEQLREPYQRTVLWINNDFFETCKQNFFADAGSSQYAPQKQLPYVIRPEGTLLNQIDQLLAALLYEGSTMRLGSELYRMGLFLQLFCLFYRMNDHPQSDIPKPENTGLLDQILNYIELHLSEDLSLASISAQFMVSQSTVSQLFKKQLDTGFYKIVTQRRLIESKNLINSGIPLKEVAEQCGFCDYSVFYKAFVKEYGISPRSFRTREKETHDFY